MPRIADLVAKMKDFFHSTHTTVKVEADRRRRRVLMDFGTLARGLDLDPVDAFLLGTRLRTAAKRMGHRPVYPTGA